MFTRLHYYFVSYSLTYALAFYIFLLYASCLQIIEELSPLNAPFAPRTPFKHWSLKSPTIALPGIDPHTSQGVLCSHTPLYPMLDTCDRAAVARCWRTIRTHFAPLGPPVGERDHDEDDEDDDNESYGHHHHEQQLPHSPMVHHASHSPSSPWRQRGATHLLPLAQKHQHLLRRDQQRAGTQWCGLLTLYGMSQWLNARGEKFPGQGFPYDEVRRKPQSFPC